MKTVARIRSTFDPISKQAIKDALQLCKKEVDCVVFELREEGVLSLQTRKKLLQEAIRPYRNFYLSLPKNTKVILEKEMDYTEEEKKIQSGSFKYAANGTHKSLLHNHELLLQVAKNQCSQRRWLHSQGVADVCVQLAKVHHVDMNKAWIAGILHDVTKKRDKTWSEAILKRSAPEMLSYPEPVWHSYTAPVWLKEELGLRDKEILNAIKHHTLGTGQSKLDRILYIADKCEPNRGYDASKEIELSKQNLKKGFELVYHEAEEYRKQGGE